MSAAPDLSTVEREMMNDVFRDEEQRNLEHAHPPSTTGTAPGCAPVKTTLSGFLVPPMSWFLDDKSREQMRGMLSSQRTSCLGTPGGLTAQR